MKNSISLAGLLVVCMSSNYSMGGDAQIVADAVRGWNRLEDIGKGFTYFFETMRDDGVGHNPASNDYALSRVEASFRGNNVLLHTFFDKDDGTEMQFLACRNDDYVFRIVQSDQGGHWRMDDLELPERINHSIPFDTENIDIIFSPWSIVGIPLRVIVDDPSFSLITVSPRRDENNNELMSFSFELKSINSDFELLDQIRQCTVILDPRHDYSVVSFEAKFEGADEHFGGRGKCTYDFSVDPPVLKSYDYTLLRERGTQREITWNTKVNKVVPCILEQKDFRLPAYGFSEPSKPTSTKWWMTVRIVSMVIGILLIIIGLYLRWFAVKKS